MLIDVIIDYYYIMFIISYMHAELLINIKNYFYVSIIFNSLDIYKLYLYYYFFFLI